MDKVKITDLFDDNLDAAIDEQYQTLVSDPRVNQEIKRLGASEAEVKENIAAFIAFQDDQSYCSKCPDLTGCQKPQHHYQVRLERVGRFIERTFAPCPLLMAKMERDRRYLYTDFDEAWKDATLGALDGKHSRSQVIAAALPVIRGQSQRWLFLTGAHRVGKSFLMVTFINELLAQGAKQAAVINAGIRFKELLDLAINDKAGFKTTFDQLAAVPVLGIDDFGNEYKSDFLRDQIVYPLLLERAKNKKTTLFTSDFKINEIGTLYATSEAGKIRSRQLVRLLKDYAENELEVGGLSGLY
jgi:DNA replication protein DnaC